MSASQAASLALLLAPVNPPRALPRDDQGRAGGGWQQAYQAAAQGSEPAPGGVEEAARMLALGNLALSPAQALPLPPATHAAAPGADVAGVGNVAEAPNAAAAAALTPAVAPTPVSGSTPVRVASQKPAKHPEHAPNTPGVVADVYPDVRAASQVAPRGASVRGGDVHAAGRSSSGRPSVSPSPDTTPQVAASRPVHAAPETAAQQAIASYAAAMSAANASSERATDFALFAGSSKLPVRIHVQWRDRVADVWIGLHRQAFDQLPDIRTGVEDWIASRGGVLGRVVCNGEALGRVAPSVSFLGAP